MPLFDYLCPNGHYYERYIKKRDFEPACPTCHEKGEKVWLPSSGASIGNLSAYPKTTSDITGKPVTFTDAAHERAFLREHNERTGENIRLRDDAAFVDKRHEGMDWKTGEPIYSEGTGQGMKGTWGGLPSGHPWWKEQVPFDDEED